MPPRARNRDWSTRVRLWARAVSNRLFPQNPQNHRLAQWINSFDAGSLWIPELWLSLLWPGLGHLALGLWFHGIAFCLVSGGLLLLLYSFVHSTVALSMTSMMLIVGLYLGLVHGHVIICGRHRRITATPAWIANIMLPLLIMGVAWLQLETLGRMFYGQEFRRDTRGFQLRGVNFYAPVLLSGDLLDVQPVAEDRLQHGDILMISRVHTERVLGLPGDILELRDNEILRNGRPIPPEDAPLVRLGFQGGPDEAIYQAVHSKQSLTVRDGAVGILWWGRQLRNVDISAVHGRIEGILMPEDRRCRFRSGQRAVHEPGLAPKFL